MKPSNLLSGKWEVIGSERYCNSTWRHTDNHIKAMTWTFLIEYYNYSKAIGSIIEKSPDREPIEHNYTYSSEDNILKIVLFSDDFNGVIDDCHANRYEVTLTNQGSRYRPIIKLGVLPEDGSSAPCLRYTLQKV